MVLKIAIPGKMQFKMMRREPYLLHRKGDVHYIGGAEVLPPPLPSEQFILLRFLVFLNYYIPFVEECNFNSLNIFLHFVKSASRPVNDAYALIRKTDCCVTKCLFSIIILFLLFL